MPTTKFLFLVVASIDGNPTYWIALTIGDSRVENVYLSAEEADKLRSKLQFGETDHTPSGNHYSYYH